jgi:hypothetical protein
MAQFARLGAQRWHREVPGARWFRADLHVHTLDDYPGGHIRWSGRSEPPIDDELLDEYARALLRTAVARGVEVIGLTPHAVYCERDETLSATWRIVEVWNNEKDSDGTPFREKVYSVFPGFEPSMRDGSRGVHLLFLFDPEIGREGLVRAFHVVMDGVGPWDGSNLVNAGRPAAAALQAVADLAKAEGRWDWLCLAPHSFSGDRGLFGQLKSQMLQHFPHEHVAGLELGDTQMPEDARRGKDWLAPAMAKYHQAFFHASDAYRLNSDPTSNGPGELGSLTTYFKLAEPRIEALRQAFLAGDSRTRLAMRRDAEASGALGAAAGVESLPLTRPWMRSVRVMGGASFFGGIEGGRPQSTTVRFNPDLTCVIGGRMSGKSTLLDGLRVAFDFPLPVDEQVAGDVQGRGQKRFLLGSPSVDVDICGPSDPTAAISERWPAVFFTQRELQQAVVDQQGLRELLFQLVPGQGRELRGQFERVAALSRTLVKTVPQLEAALTELGDAEQALAGAAAAKDALERYERVGATQLSKAQADVGRLRSAQAAAARVRQPLDQASTAAASMTVPEILSERIDQTVDPRQLADLAADLANAAKALAEAAHSLDRYQETIDELVQLGQTSMTTFHRELERALVAAGGTAEELNQFAALSETAQRHEERRLRAEHARNELASIRSRLQQLRQDRDEERAAHRSAVGRVIEAIGRGFGSRVRVRVVEDGLQDALAKWVMSLRERGVTRWWNESGNGVSPSRMLEALSERDLASLGMSEQVADTFTQAMSETRRWELAGVNTPDSYILQQLVESGEYRDLAELSGGSQVSLLLSLLLEADDPRPLVIDQPEDELDKASLFDLVLPALRRLKGRRQLIIVTHDANIVVNGDADQVVYLRANADRGWVAAEGAIEQAQIRAAILTVLDGGEEAFELRSRKYGF